MKKLLGLVFIFGIAVSGAYYVYDNALSHQLSKRIPLIVEKGETFNSILQKVTSLDKGISPRLAKVYLKINGLSKSLKRGEYVFEKGETLESLLEALSEGRVLEHVVVVPEGYNLFEIAQILSKKGILSSQKAFLNLVRSPISAEKFMGFKAPSLEGYLYPATYKFAKETAPSLIVKKMTQAHKDNFDRLLKEVGQLPKGFDHHKLVTLASVVEKETGAAFERPIIASVFLNRLAKKMRLQSDPTTIYGEWVKTGERLFNIRKKHLQTLNAYNTYKIKALPIGPIANPGYKAMLAVCVPDKKDFYYFVSKNDGTHYFSKTYKEHARAVRRYQMSRKARKGKSWRDLNKKN